MTTKPNTQQQTQKQQSEYFYCYPDSKRIREQWTSCADCNDPSPNWAEIGHGILICSKCAGVHRGFGTVHSITLDKWQPSWVQNVKESQITFNNIWEYHVISHYTKPTVFSERSLRETFIKAKYESVAFHANNFKNGGKPLPAQCDDNFTGIVKMHVKNAKELPKADLFSDSDPYIVLDNGKKTVKSSIIDDNNDPVWKNEFILIAININEPFKVSIYDENEINADALLCWQFVDLNDAIRRQQMIAFTSTGSLNNEVDFIDCPMIVDGRWKKQKKKSQFTFSISYNHMTGTNLLMNKIAAKNNNNTNNSTNNNNNNNNSNNSSDNDSDGAFIKQNNSSTVHHPFIDHRSDDCKESGMVQYTGVLKITLIGAQHLPKADLLSDSDPYVVFDNGHQSVKSKVIDDDNDPTWNEELVLSVNTAEAIKISIFDEDSFKSDDLLCIQYLDVGEQCPDQQEVEFSPMKMVLSPSFASHDRTPVLVFSVVYEKMQ